MKVNLKKFAESVSLTEHRIENMRVPLSLRAFIKLDSKRRFGSFGPEKIVTYSAVNNDFGNYSNGLGRVTVSFRMVCSIFMF